jgi:hypothetical protein
MGGQNDSGGLSCWPHIGESVFLERCGPLLATAGSRICWLTFLARRIRFGSRKSETLWVISSFVLTVMNLACVVKNLCSIQRALGRAHCLLKVDRTPVLFSSAFSTIRIQLWNILSSTKRRDITLNYWHRRELSHPLDFVSSHLQQRPRITCRVSSALGNMLNYSPIFLDNSLI